VPENTRTAILRNHGVNNSRPAGYRNPQFRFMVKRQAFQIKQQKKNEAGKKVKPDRRRLRRTIPVGLDGAIPAKLTLY
jgi:hypothetical protein